jgi:uncharacterized lipoprotein YajG
MSLKRNCGLASLIACIVLAGCATNRSEVMLSAPMAAPTTRAGATRFAVIRSVKDERVFEEAPVDPSVPSLGFEGAAQAPAEIKARAIGRKRNTLGMALGDVLLQKGQTVDDVVRDNLTAALQQAGFQVQSADNAGPSALVVDVHVKQFWAWVQIGFWALTLKANISTSLDLSGAASTSTISVHVEDSRQLATDSAWIEVVDKALQAYRSQAAEKAVAFR